MNLKPSFLLFTAAITATLLGGCVFGPKGRPTRQFGESMVFIGEESAVLAHMPEIGQPISVRSTYQQELGTTNYVEGRDFVVDYSRGTLSRTQDSRLPDFCKNVLFGQEDFDHGKFPGFGNGGFFAFVDYTFRQTESWPMQAKQTKFLGATKKKLRSGQEAKIVAFGDSITAGGDASKPEFIFWRRWADDLQRKYPKARVTAVNGATGGDSTVLGLQRLESKVLQENPDLVLIGFGMNDHNVGGVAIPQFEKNVHEMIARIRSSTRAEVVLFSAFPPNPKWKFGTHHMEDYAAATSRVARESAGAYADVFRNWQSFAERKKPEDLLGNNINHPNDFGHWIYFQVLGEMGL
jgi:lysophospholipase L1-like esterase